MLEELQRAAGAMQLGIDAAKAYFAEDAKLGAEEFFSRWSLFLGQLDTALANAQEDAKKAAKAGRRR